MKASDFKAKVEINRNSEAERAKEEANKILAYISETYIIKNNTVSLKLDNWTRKLDLIDIRNAMIELGYKDIKLAYGEDQRDQLNWLEVSFSF